MVSFLSSKYVFLLVIICSASYNQYNNSDSIPWKIWNKLYHNNNAATSNSTPTPVTTNSTTHNESALLLSAKMELPEIPYTQTGDFLLMTHVEAPFYQLTERAPVDIVVVVDKSGSMVGEKIDLVKDMLKHMVTSLRSDDQLILVTFSDYTITMNDLIANGKEAAYNIINGIRADGGTNLCGGLLEGVQQIYKRERVNKVASVLLFTDGQATHPPTTAQGIWEAVASLIKKNDDSGLFPATINTFGFGHNHDADLLK
jgi:hypothetical protein